MNNNLSELRRQAEERLKNSGVTPDILRSKEELLRIVQELSIHQIELEMQNETLQDSRDEIEREHNRFINLYNFAPVGYLTLARDGTIREANHAIARMLSVERSHLQGGKVGFGRFIVRQDLPAFNSMVVRVFQSRTQEHCEIMIENHGPTTTPTKLQRTLRLDAIISDNPHEFLLSLTDISDTRQALELALANKELAFQNEEKEKRAAELVIANKKLVFQNEEKEKRAAELILAITAQKDAEQKILSYVT